MELESIRLQYMVGSCRYCSLRHTDSARYVIQIVLATSHDAVTVNTQVIYIVLAASTTLAY